MNLLHRLMKLTRAFVALIYGLTLSYLVFFARRRRHLDERILNVVPIKHTALSYRWLDHSSFKDLFNFYSNLIGNILLFIPLPLILASVLHVASIRKIMLVAVSISLFIEAVQYIFKLGVADIDDILLNVAGAVVGVLLMKAVNRLGAVPLFPIQS